MSERNNFCAPGPRASTAPVYPPSSPRRWQSFFEPLSSRSTQIFIGPTQFFFRASLAPGAEYPRPCRDKNAACPLYDPALHVERNPGQPPRTPDSAPAPPSPRSAPRVEQMEKAESRYFQEDCRARGRERACDGPPLHHRNLPPSPETGPLPPLWIIGATHNPFSRPPKNRSQKSGPHHFSCSSLL